MSPEPSPSCMGNTQVHELSEVGGSINLASGLSASPSRLSLAVTPLKDLNVNGNPTCFDTVEMSPQRWRLHSPPPPPALPPSGLNIPPPPPPVLPPSGMNIPLPPQHLTKNVHDSITALHQNAFIDGLDREQEDLRDSRDILMGSRFRLRAKRRELRDARIVASGKDGSLFNVLRQYLHENDLPEHIKEELEAASDFRDYLGPMEASYDELELEFDAQEWDYTRKESRFIDRLVDSNLVPIGTPLRSAENLQAANLTSFAVGDSAVLDSKETGNLPYVKKDLRDAGIVLGPASFLSRYALKNPKNDNEDRTLHQRRTWAEKMAEIDQWVQENISGSPLCIARSENYRGSLDSLEDDCWWEKVKQNWGVTYDGLPAFHTGDSTISQSVVSALPSSKASTSQSSEDDGASETAESLELATQKASPTHDEFLDGSNTGSYVQITHSVPRSSSTSHSPSCHTSSSMDQAIEPISHASLFRNHCSPRAAQERPTEPDCLLLRI